MTTYTTKQVADRLNLSVSQLQYYDQLGIIPDLKRTANGYRQFTDANVTWLTQVMVFIDSGMPLKDIQRLTTLVLAGKQQTAPQQNAIIAHHLAHLKQRQVETAAQITFIENFLAEHPTN
ncbi:MerR family transcriptional regulator [Levilactobacillus zymae]|uniref:MerR family transcriptional regulator n=1 Tax=Levilactobacillus zymae TaxID=267363 RepID=UPI0028B74FAA|nr:MerR family transcriptional regulator [Levilactobacillus zymae]MDT6980758.1 MerR family transcriptional regulator [Levilactobacillus zymae]